MSKTTDFLGLPLTDYPKVMDLLWRSLFTAMAERDALEAGLKG